jgi:hypothetical protein
MHVSCETNPFTNKVFFSETVFFHAPSKSLITTDLFWNYPSTGAVNGQLKKQLGYEGEEDFGSWELGEIGRRAKDGWSEATAKLLYCLLT